MPGDFKGEGVVRLILVPLLSRLVIGSVALLSIEAAFIKVSLSLFYASATMPFESAPLLLLIKELLLDARPSEISLA